LAVSAPYFNDALDLSCPCEQTLLDLIDEVLEDRIQAEIKQEKLKKRRASRVLLAEKRSKITKTVAEISAGDKSPGLNSEKDGLKIRKLTAAKEIQLSAIKWIKAHRPPTLYRDWYTMMVAYWMSGKDSDFTGQPIPSYSTVYNWLQRHKDAPDSIQEIPGLQFL
jgi:hypothetical protein